MVAQRSGAERLAAAEVHHDVDVVVAIVTAYRGLACDRAVWTEEVERMVTDLRLAGMDLKPPSDAAEWRVRYPGGRPNTLVWSAAAGALQTRAPMRTAGNMVVIERRSVDERMLRVFERMGGRAEGTSAVLSVPGAKAPQDRARRGFLARRGMSSC